MSVNSNAGEGRTEGLEAALASFRSYLSRNGLRFTAQRRAVLRATFRSAGHFDAEQLKRWLCGSEQGVSRATVYRTLNHLCQAGLVRKVMRRDGRSFYEAEYGHSHHDHMLCVECGRVIEFCDNYIERLQERICRRHDFEPRDHVMAIRGLCKACRSEVGDE